MSGTSLNRTRGIGGVIGLSLIIVFCMSVALEAGTFFVSTNGNHTAPFDTWAKAANDIQSAVNVATNDADTVLVTNGTYTLGSTITISSWVTVRSVNGAVGAIVDGNNSVRCFSITHSNAVLDGFTVTNGNFNTAASGVHITDGLVKNCRITGCIAPGWAAEGAGMYVQGGIVSNCFIYNNGPVHFGGGIFMDTTGLVVNCVISNNIGNFTGGGVEMRDNTTVRNCMIIRNWLVNFDATYVKGAGVRGGSAGNVLDNCLIIENMSPIYCAAVSFTGGKIRNCTIVGNRCGVATSTGLQGSGTARNCIIMYNVQSSSHRAGTHSTVPNVNWGGTLEYSCTTPAVAGTGNITNAPLFVNRMTGDYRLLPGSPCIDSGTDLSGIIVTDLDGVARPKDGDGVGGVAYDMGAYEAADATAGALRCGFSVSPSEAFTNLTCVLSASVAGEDTSITYYGWDFTDDGTIDVAGSTKAVVTNNYSSGLHTVSLTVSNVGAETATTVRSNCVYVAYPTIYVSPNGQHIMPYETWQNAATSINAAVDAAIVQGANASTVMVTNGTYVLELGINLDKAIRLESVNGSADTIIDGNGKQRCFRITGSPTIDGFTVRNGRIYGTGNSKGAGVEMIGAGTIRNCTFSSHVNSSYDGAVWMGNAGALIENCIIVSNSVGRWGGGIAFEKSGGSAGTARNCLIAHNSASQDGGGISQYRGNSFVINCTVVSNNASRYGGGLWRDGDTLTVSNSIITHNFALTEGHDMYGVIAATYSCSPSLTNGTGNITADPILKPGYKLHVLSPCVDSGANLLSVTNDLVGLLRPQDGDGDGSSIQDMGAYELADQASGQFGCDFIANSNSGIGQMTVTFNGAFVGVATNTPVTYFWDFDNDGTADSWGTWLSEVNHDYTQSLYYTVTLICSNESNGSMTTQTYANMIYIVPDTMYVATNGSHTPPFDTWAKAATSITECVDAAIDGSVVIVGDGTYSVTSPIKLDVACRLTSVNGAEATIIQRAVDAINLVYVTNSAASVSGFTIRDAFRESAVLIGRGSVSNCIIEDNLLNVTGQSKGSAVRMEGPGVLKNCLIRNNVNSRYDGAVWIDDYRAVVSGCTIVSNTSQRWGGGVAFERVDGGGTLRNCLIAWNHSNQNGGGVSQYRGFPLIESCTIVSNTANTSGGGIWMSTFNKLSVTNCIVWNNSATTDNDISGSVLIGYCCSPDVSHGVNGSITNAPLFVDAQGGDFTLLSSSPCKGAGIERPWMATGKDLAGEARILGTAVEIGAYEVVPPSGVVIVIR